MEFFINRLKKSSHFVFPYGMGLSGSIIYTDPLFILAFPFKLFSRILHDKFQYEALWMLLCFALQALFSWQLLKKITHNQKLLLMGTLFFILSPVFLFRIQLPGQVSFLSQWLILAGILLYLSIGFRPYGRCILFVVSSLIHPYFLLMLLAIWVADLIIGNLNYTIENPSTIKQMIIPKWVINNNNFLRFPFKFKSAISPKKLNLSLDNRQ